MIRRNKDDRDYMVRPTASDDNDYAYPCPICGEAVRKGIQHRCAEEKLNYIDGRDKAAWTMDDAGWSGQRPWEFRCYGERLAEGFGEGSWMGWAGDDSEDQDDV